MQRRKALLRTITLLMVAFIAALTGMGVFAALYINEKNENNRLHGELSTAIETVRTLESVEVFNSYEPEPEQTPEPEQIWQSEQAASEELIEESIKQKMKDLVLGEDGSPLRMLRSFFPENLIYYDEEEYVFSPVLDAVKKHELIPENFVETEDGEMQYVENGVVTSHKGIDVSKYQGEIDWPAVKADDIEYAFIRLGLRGYESGKLVVDEFFEQNISGANEAGVKAGVYFFTQAVTVEEAVEEAAFVVENLAGYEVSYPVVFDVEMIVGANGRANNLTMQERTDIAIAFCEAVKAAGYTPMIYGNVKCFTKLLDMTRLEEYEKWYAFYDNYMYMPYLVSCWQYTESGTVDGIKGKVDLNISYKTW
ncbi:MAG: glycoside hydrolase family 25 protein [Roseburia sp.]|nr:glycoside hydrolase family 25 protein [Roseburia sp.]